MGALADTVKPLVPGRVRFRILERRLDARQLLPVERALPDFLVIGAQRCGTSSLYKYLSRHPGVVAPLRKETEYLSRHHVKGLDWYRRHFPTRAQLRIRSRLGHGAAVTFEATPDYLLHPRAAERAAALLPEARLVVLVRDPVQRALSHHQHMTRLGFETLAFDDALNQEATRLAGERSRILADDTYPSPAFLRFSYMERGHYLDQLRAWTDCYPRERLLVVRSEDLYGDPRRCFGHILAFLGLAAWQPTRFRNHSHSPTDNPAAMPDATRDRLNAHFEDHNLRLCDYLGRDLGWGANR